MREDGTEFTRADLEGNTTVLVFYPFAFSPVCTDQLGLYEEVLGDYLAKRGATMYGVSCDARWSQTAFRREARRDHPAAVRLRAQGRGVPRVRRLPPRRLPAARARDRRTRRRRGVELPGPSPGELPGANLIFDGLDATAGRSRELLS